MEVGDNYLSKMYRVDVHAKGSEEEAPKEESFIIKSLEVNNPLMESFGIFDTEKEVYVDVLPEFEKYWAGIGKPTKFGPK